MKSAGRCWKRREKRKSGSRRRSITSGREEKRKRFCHRNYNRPKKGKRERKEPLGKMEELVKKLNPADSTWKRGRGRKRSQKKMSSCKGEERKRKGGRPGRKKERKTKKKGKGSPLSHVENKNPLAMACHGGGKLKSRGYPERGSAQSGTTGMMQ